MLIWDKHLEEDGGFKYILKSNDLNKKYYFSFDLRLLIFINGDVNFQN